MKNSNKCLKCGSNDLIFVPGNSGAYGTGNNIPTGATIFSSALVDRYICASCGYSEEWIRKEDIERIRKKYSK